MKLCKQSFRISCIVEIEDLITLVIKNSCSIDDTLHDHQVSILDDTLSELHWVQGFTEYVELLFSKRLIGADALNQFYETFDIKQVQ